jgi:hypothetical protein
MRIEQLLIETKIDEAPMGMLNKFGNKVMSKFGSRSATGRLNTGNLANQIHGDWEEYLGATGEEASAETVIAFLKSKGYPTQRAMQILQSAPKAGGITQTAPAGPGADPDPTAGTPPFKPDPYAGAKQASRDRLAASQAQPKPNLPEGVLAEDALDPALIDKALMAAAQDAQRVTSGVRSGQPTGSQASSGSNPAATNTPVNTTAPEPQDDPHVAQQGGQRAAVAPTVSGAGDSELADLKNRIAAIEKKVGITNLKVA